MLGNRIRWSSGVRWRSPAFRCGTSRGEERGPLLPPLPPRWSVIHRTAIRFPTYLAESLLNPIPLAVIGFALRPSSGAAVTLVACAVLKPTLDAVAFSRLRREMFSWQAFGVVWVKDLLLFLTWVHGLFARTVVWRGNRLRVCSGSRLVPLVASAPTVASGFAASLPSLHGAAPELLSDLRA